MSNFIIIGGISFTFGFLLGRVSKGNTLGSGFTSVSSVNGHLFLINGRSIRRSGKTIYVKEDQGSDIDIKVDDRVDEEDDIEVSGNFNTVKLCRRVGNIKVLKGNISELTIDTASGEVESQANVKNLRISGSNGIIKLNGPFEIGVTDIRSSNGSIQVNGLCTFKNLFFAKTSNGTVRFSDAVKFICPELVEIVSSNGSLYVPRSLLVRKAKTSNGSVKVQVSGIGAELRTSNGSIKYSDNLLSVRTHF